MYDLDARYFCRKLISKKNIKMPISNIGFYDLYQGSSQASSVHEYTHAEAMGTHPKPTRLGGGLSVNAGRGGGGVGVATGPPGLIS